VSMPVPAASRPFDGTTPRRILRGSSLRGFSLIEVIVVCTMLAVIAVAVIPKVVVVQRQREEKAIVQVEDLLRMYAFRNASGTQQLAIAYDRRSGELALWIKDLNPSDPDGPRVWQQDRLSSAIELPEGMGIEFAAADGAPMLEDAWSIATNPDGSRPRIELEVAGAEKSASLVLETYSATPRRLDDPRAIAREAIDLDAAGGMFDRW
jgi:prepilin-type N-terminal cleavage/methylation domain-containing protein